jgi:hypothetical protein
MDPLVIILGPGILGGILFALIIRRVAGSPDDGRQLAPPSTGMINMARIRVEGGGGLGMLAMAVCVALFVPRIRSTMEVAAALGLMLAVGLILWRRRTGPLPSAGRGPGAHSMLPLDTTDARDRAPVSNAGLDLLVPVSSA